MITPRFDARGISVVHRASPSAKLVWLVGLTIAASILEEPLPLAVLVAQTLVIYAMLWAGKATPPPPILRLVAFVAVLLFILNLLLAGTQLGRWAEGLPEGDRQSKLALVRHAGAMALRVSATMLSFVVFVLSTVPRDFARTLERFRVPTWLTEVLSLGLRFFPVFEVNLKMLLRGHQLRQPAVLLGRGPRALFVRFHQLMFGALVMALAQASFTGQSLRLHHFDGQVRRCCINDQPLSSSSLVFWVLSVLSLVCAVLISSRWLSVC